MSKRTPLYAEHVKLGGTIVDFAGYELPVQYPTGILAEHKAVRERVGLFDVSHMGELIVSGDNAEAALNAIVTNDIRGMYDGQVRYSLLPNERGGAVDDILIYRLNANAFLVVVNASNADKDAAWVEAHLPSDVKFQNISDSVAQIAIQGPLAAKVIAKLTDEADVPVKYYSFKAHVQVGGIDCILSRTGYTGESGFEVYCAVDEAEKMYETLLEAGKEEGIIPCGLGARDTLRLEAAMPLYGHELNEDIPIAQVGLDFAVKLGKEDFIGRKAIAVTPADYVRIGAKVVDRGIAREHTDVYTNGEVVGTVTSGTFSPTLGIAICMLRIKTSALDSELFADVRGRKLRLERVPLPFYKKSK